MGIKLAIIDLDQTLIHSIKRFYKLFNDTLMEFGSKPISWDEFFKSYCMDDLNKYLPGNVNPRFFWLIFRRKYSQEPIHPEDHLIPGAKEALKYLKERGVKVVVVTGREMSKDKLWRELERFNLREYVDDVYSIAYQDPREEEIDFLRSGLLRNILKMNNVEPCEAIFVADYWVDMESCRRVGLHCIAVKTGYESEEKLKRHGAKVVIDSIKDLPRVLEELQLI